MEGNYPEEFIRGVSGNNDQFITPEGYPTQAAFQFDKWDLTQRSDEFRELSINWLDDEGAISVLLNQMNTKKGTPQFQGGYCKILKSQLDSALRAYISNKHVSYERRPVTANEENGFQDNPYHGNILMKNKLSKQAITNIQVTLAALAGTVIRRPTILAADDMKDQQKS